MTKLNEHFATQAQMLELCRHLDKLNLKGFIEQIDEAEKTPLRLERAAVNRIASIKQVAQSLLLSQEAFRDLRTETRRNSISLVGT